MLSIDFTFAKVRGQAGFADLAPQLPEGYTTWGTDETAWAAQPGSQVAQLEAWLDRGCAVDAPVRAIFGFCGAAALAPVLARRLADPQPPAVVLFDPIVVGPQNMIDQTVDSLRQLAGPHAVDEAEVLAETSLANGGHNHNQAPDLDRGSSGTDGLPADLDLTELATQLTRHYTIRAEQVGAAKSIRPSTVADLCRRFEAYLRYLALCGAAWSARRIQPDLIALSRDHDVPEELAGTPVVRVDTTQHVLLGHPDAARAAAAVLTGRNGGQ